jgi:hypothetical protein
MPTGYTADVQSGKITEFRDFAMQCARAFGALITMRDDPHDAAVPQEFQPNTKYYDELIAGAKAILDELPQLSDAECNRRAMAAHADELDSHLRYARERQEHRSRYEAMLSKVREWQPPTAEHEEMKAFMAKQLSESIDFDCSERYQPEAPTLLPGAVWRETALAKAARDLAYGQEGRCKELKRTADRNKWLADLRASLGHA